MKPQELKLAPVQPGEPPMKQLAPFDDFRAQAERLKLTAETLTVSDINDKAGMKLARATRLELRDVRIAIDKRRKELGEHHLRETQRINADAKALRELIEPLESRLEDQEKFIERETARIEDERRLARTAEITPFLNAPLMVDIGKPSDEDYIVMLADAKAAHDAKIERERKEAEEAAARAKAEAEERERIRLENERLKKEAAEREATAKKERAEREAAQAKAEAAVKAEREKIEAERKAERDAAEARAREIEAKAKMEREEAEKKAAAERKEREKIEAELRERKEREEAEAMAKADAERAAKKAPDKEKIKALAATVRGIVVPTLTSEDGKKAAAEIGAKVEAFAVWIEGKAKQL